MRGEERKEPLVSRAKEWRVPYPGVAARLLCELAQFASSFCASVSLSAKLEGWSSLISQNRKTEKGVGRTLGWAVRCSWIKDSGIFLLPSPLPQTKVHPAEGRTY